MKFRYYERLNRTQQSVYRQSDAQTAVRLRHPAALRPLVPALAAALESEDRARVEQVTARLVSGLTEDLGIPPLRVQVLAVRPHAQWGELHGLYTSQPGRPAKIQLWMRTAKQARVVAFRTYLRTLLHEVGHHIDYQLLRLADSYHTEGFYKRESSLFHQLVNERMTAMPTIEEYAKQPTAERIDRLRRTADELAAAIRGLSEAALSRRPDPKNWAAKEIVCHLRDTEESFVARIELILSIDEPKFMPIDPDRWAEERQYLRSDAGPAVEAFRRRREETLALLAKLGPEQWKRAGIHATRGRMTCDTMLTLIAWHDDNHLAQIHRALEGRA